MIGSTLVALPYGISTSGLCLGSFLIILMGCICGYTCLLVVVHGRVFSDFGDMVQYHFGRKAQYAAMSVSVSVLIGACIAYHVLMTQCLFKMIAASFSTVLGRPWTPGMAALMIIVLFPITLVKNVSSLVTLNSFGIPFMLYTILFIIYHGISASFDHPPHAMDYVVWGGKSSFGILGGIVTLSYFIHNAIQPIVRNSNPLTRKVCCIYYFHGTFLPDLLFYF